MIEMATIEEATKLIENCSGKAKIRGRAVYLSYCKKRTLAPEQGINQNKRVSLT